MRTTVALGVWAYMVVAVLAEVLTFYRVSAYSTVATVVTILATSQQHTRLGDKSVDGVTPAVRLK